MKYLAILLCSVCSPAFAQDISEGVNPNSSVKISEWNEFQNTQEKIFARQGTIADMISRVDRRVRQIPLFSRDISEGVNPNNSVKIREWNEFQNTQEKIVERQGIISDRIGKIDQRIRQININLLSWQDATQNAAAGDNRGCDLFKSKYDPRVEWTVVGLAVWGIYLTLNKFFSLFKKSPVIPPVAQKTGV